VDNLRELYTSDNIAAVSEAWNAWRHGVLTAAVKERLLPTLLQEVRSRLTAATVEEVALRVQDQ
jgi:transcriptional accessory protein Tex/SPT6